jgi:hypothetical protein
LLDRCHAELPALVVDDQDLADANPFVDAEVSRYGRLLAGCDAAGAALRGLL